MESESATHASGNGRATGELPCPGFFLDKETAQILRSLSDRNREEPSEVLGDLIREAYRWRRLKEVCEVTNEQLELFFPEGGNSFQMDTYFFRISCELSPVPSEKTESFGIEFKAIWRRDYPLDPNGLHVTVLQNGDERKILEKVPLLRNPNVVNGYNAYLYGIPRAEFYRFRFSYIEEIRH